MRRGEGGWHPMFDFFNSVESEDVDAEVGTFGGMVETASFVAKTIAKLTVERETATFTDHSVFYDQSSFRTSPAISTARLMLNAGDPVDLSVWLSACRFRSEAEKELRRLDSPPP